jgi:hypothetical protein
MRNYSYCIKQRVMQRKRGGRARTERILRELQELCDEREGLLLFYRKMIGRDGLDQD